MTKTSLLRQSIPRPKLVQGIIPPLVTPLAESDTLDIAGLERLIEHLAEGGVQGLFALGTTGEGPSLSYRLRREMITHTCQQAAGRLPVLVGITDTSRIESLRLAAHAAEAGATAVVLAPPYYFPLSQRELRQYVTGLLSELSLPLLLYNMPSRTGVTFELETVTQLTADPRIVGIKDSSGDMGYFHGLLRAAHARPDWSVLMGNESLLAEAVLFGADGGVPGGGNVFPALFVSVYAAALTGDVARVRLLQSHILAIAESLYLVGESALPGVMGIKCALSCLDICSDLPAAPFEPFSKPERNRIHALVLHLITQQKMV